MEYNSYTEHIVENHLLIREKMKPYVDSVEILSKNHTFLQRVGPVLYEVEDIIKRNESLNVPTRKDSLLYAISTGLIFNYREMINKDFIEIHSVVNTRSVEEQNRTIDSLKTKFFEYDKRAVKHFNEKLDSNHSRLIPFQ
ncbi:MAG: hypothetical protein KJP21_04560 [Bacteroidia bacterium]|nr:hypothetical protein [Bacteroidia bacterium]